MSATPGPTQRWLNLGAGLEDKVVIVTGAGGGIGRAVAEAFARCGALVVATDIRADGLEQLLDGMGRDRHAILPLDLADVGQHAALLAAAAELGEPLALVHCAAVLRRTSKLRDVTVDDWDLQLDTNVKATFFLCREFAEHFVRSGTAGRIVTFASQGWWTGGFGGSVVYNAGKGAVVTMSRGLARTYGPHGITVNSVAPGQVRTPMLMKGLDPAVLQRMTDDTPLRRVAEPAEVASVAVFLASDHASFVSGATINVSGGFLMY